MNQSASPLLAIAGTVPVYIAGSMLALSALAYVMYWLDKSASKRGGRRTPESTLHLVSLLGGWPGALIAQRQFRHKTIKQPFQAIFWVTVVINLVVAAWLLTTMRG